MKEKKKKVVAFLPAKGTSERIPSKNSRLLNGRPLFYHTLKKLCACDFIDEVYLDSESDEILNYAPYLRYIPLKRDASLATNQTDGHELFFHEVRQTRADIYIQILGTSPFIKKETIKKGIDILLEHPEYDSVVLMKTCREYVWENGQPAYDRRHIPNSNTLAETVTEAMGLYMVRHEAAWKYRMRYGEHIYMLKGDASETIDVNNADEFELADTIMKGLTAKETIRFGLLSKYLNSAVFADLLSERGIDAVISGLKPNIPGIARMGRANTLKLRALEISEDYRGIYEALKTYQTVAQGEMIVVENEVCDRAYFGELNAYLAVRCAAAGTIIGGVTRDMAQVAGMGYPVWSAGYSCADVKYRATVASSQMPVKINGIQICPGDILFADDCGIVRIPQNIESEILRQAVQSIGIEKNVLKKVLDDCDAFKIYESEGEF